MSFKKLTLAAALAALVGTSVPVARGQDAGALLDLLVRKKLITDQEAEEVRADLTKETAATSAGKWKLSAPISEIELYGDARIRYEFRGGETAGNVPLAKPGAGVAGANDWQERSRERYRLRIGLRGNLTDDWFFGVRLETSSNPRSTNVTFGDDSSNGPFAKTNDGIGVGQAYIGYRGIKDVTLIVGKMPNPLVTTLMTWDGDINPEGVSEQYKHSFTFNFGSSGAAQAAVADAKDSKNLAVTSTAATSEPWKLKIDLFANFAQFVYDDANPENPLGARATSGGRLVPNTDAWLLAWQVGARFNFPKNIYAQVAPTLDNYTGQGDTFNANFVGGSPFLTNAASLSTNQNGIGHLLVVDVPTEFGFKIGELPFRVFGDFAVNLEGEDRAIAAGFPTKTDQRYAYMIGAGIGQLKTKRDWQLQAWYQHTEQFALDPNLVDSDIFDSRVNMEGFVVQGGYALSDAVIFNLTYGYGWRADKGLGTGGTGDIGINPLDKYQVFQADLNVKF